MKQQQKKKTFRTCFWTRNKNLRDDEIPNIIKTRLPQDITK